MELPEHHSSALGVYHVLSIGLLHRISLTVRRAYLYEAAGGLFLRQLPLGLFLRQPRSVTPEESQKLEVLVRAVRRLIDDERTDGPEAVLLLAAIDSIGAQVKSDPPSETIIGRNVKRIAMLAGGVLAGVAADHLTDLLVHLRVPWP
ncbi:MAG TPA: hypothetical protein VK507_17530 [Iamia sp.]|nr:hypothetical protein [Iamia sp.]